jgi:hypothetical protein
MGFPLAGGSGAGPSASPFELVLRLLEPVPDSFDHPRVLLIRTIARPARSVGCQVVVRT